MAEAAKKTAKKHTSKIIIKMEVKEEEDRISQLPDAILLHIISFIDIKEAVQTTILSTRWQNLWLSLSDLHFNFTRLAVQGGVNLNNRESTQAFSLLFTNFVDRFLSRRDDASAIRTFHLSFDSRLVHADAPFVEKCVDYAINHGVRSLHLDALCRPPPRFSAAFFASKTLRELKLRQFAYGITMPKHFSLPHLKTLHLENSVFIDDGDSHSFSKDPFSGFPELEKLALHRCTVYKLVITAPKLRFLEIVQDKYFSEVMQEISAPNLTSLKYEGYFPLECSKIDVPMLEEVYFNIYNKVGKYRKIKDKWIPLRCVRMLQKFGNAKTVSLTLDTIKVLEMDRGVIEQSPSPFPYMKCLKLRKGRREILTVLERVMNYLTEGSLYGDSLIVEFPEGVCVVERNLNDLFDEDSDELQLEHLFGIEDETPSQIQNFGVFQELLLPKFGQDGRVTF